MNQRWFTAKGQYVFLQADAALTITLCKSRF